MAEIKAFKGLRYTEKAGEIGELCCPPYDIISDKERQAFIDNNPYNIIRLELPKMGGDSDNSEAYTIANQFLRDWMGKGILKNDDKDGIYVYEMDFSVSGNSYSLKGFISLIKLEEFSKGVVLPHEETLSKAKTDRLNLMTATKCNFSQIYSLYMDEDKAVYSVIDNASKGKPDYEFTDGDGVTHKLWCVYDEAMHIAVANGMADKKVYIADGHHRYETALNFRNYMREKFGDNIGSADYVPMMFVNMENSGLVVFPTHRIVCDLNNYSYDEVIERCARYFEITPFLNREKGEIGLEEAYKNGKKAFVLFTGDNNYTLLVLKDVAAMTELMPEASEALRSLDVSVLHTLVLERIFGIDKENMANQINLTYTRIADEAISAVDGKRANCCFLLNPTRVSEIRDVALAREKMPQKSTYFYPKLTTGFVLNQIVK